MRISLLLRALLGVFVLMAVEEGGGGGAADDAGAADDGAADDGRPEDISADEWAQLSPAEREAIALPDDDEVDADALAAVANAGDDADATAAKSAEDAAAAEAQAAEEAAAAQAAAASDAGFVPVFKAELPADFDAQVAALVTERGDLKQKFKDGDLEIDEYEEKREALEARQRELDAVKLKADIAADTSKQTGEQRWAWECENFYAQESSAIYDPKTAQGRMLLAAHNAAVIDLAGEDALKAHPERAKWTGPRFLQEADKLVRAGMGIKPPAAGANDQPADGKPPRNVKPVKPGDIPPRITTLPAAAAAAVDGDEFAHIANLTGMDYERAIARMSPDQAERFKATA